MNDQQFQRYQRQIMVLEVSEKGQQALMASKVLLVGCGGLGSAASLYLAAAGVGSLVVADGDAVETSNLQRQVVYRDSDLGKQSASNGRATEAIKSKLQSAQCEYFLTRCAIEFRSDAGRCCTRLQR